MNLPELPGHLVRRAQQVHNAIWQEVVGGELTSLQFAVLNTLAQSDDLDQRAVAEQIGSDRSTIADMADRLERRGLIVQQRDPTDGRRRVLELTGAGTELHGRMIPLVEQVQNRLVGGFSTSDRDRLLALLSRIVDVQYDH